MGLQNLPADRRNRFYIEREIVARAFRVPGFRSELVNDPRGILERETGARLPEGFRVVLHEEGPTQLHLVLPPRAEAQEKTAQGISDPLLGVLARGRVYQGAMDPPLTEIDDMDLTRLRIEGRLALRAAQDPGFHAELLADPKATLSRELGVEIPDEYRIEVHEETPGTLHLVLPNDPDVPAEVRDAVENERLRSLVYSCPDQCLTAGGTICGTCTLVTYCTQPPC